MYSIYQTAYELINTYVFGNTAVVGSYEDLLCIICATVASITVVALPLKVVHSMVSWVVGGFFRGH